MYDYFLHSLCIYSLYVTRRKWHTTHNFCDFLTVVVARIIKILFIYLRCKYQNDITSLLCYYSDSCDTAMVRYYLESWLSLWASVLRNVCHFDTRIFNNFNIKLSLKNCFPLLLYEFLSLSSQVCCTNIKIYSNVRYCDKGCSAFGKILSLLIEALGGRKVVEILSNFLFGTDQISVKNDWKHSYEEFC